MLNTTAIEVAVGRWPRPPRQCHPFLKTQLQCLRVRMSTAIADKSRPPPSPPFPPQPLTVLHKASALLPRVLPPNSSRFWSRVLEGAYEDLTSVASPCARIVFYGIDHWQSSGAHELVSALLINPFASDAAENTLLRSRWKDHGDVVGLTIQHQSENQPQTRDQKHDGLDIIRVQSPYLHSFALPIQITELRTSATSTSILGAEAPLDEDHLAILLDADIPVVVCNPIVTTLTGLSKLLTNLPNPNTIIVFTGLPSQDLIEPIQSLFHNRRFRKGSLQVNSPKILFIDSQRALDAIQTLESDRTSPAAVQRFQQNILGSRISSLTDALRQIMETPVATQEMSGNSTTRSQTAVGNTLRAQTANAQVQGALLACRDAVAQAESEVQHVRARTSELRGRVEESRASAYPSVFLQQTSSNNRAGVDDVNVVQKSLADAKREMDAIMHQLTWWRMVRRVDEIETTIGDALRKVWCRDLEQHLVFHSGRLSAFQDALTASTYTLLDSIPRSSALSSPILHNTLAQLRNTPTSPLTPPTIALIAPLDHRRTQLLQHPTAYLHRAAQRAVLGMGGGAVAGAGVCWAGVSAATILDLGAGTGLAAAVFGALVGVRWGISLWERAIRRWWADWARVGEGLERDLKMALEVSVSEAVKVAERGCTGLEELTSKRESEIERIKEEVAVLEDELEEGTQSPC